MQRLECAQNVEFCASVFKFRSIIALFMFALQSGSDFDASGNAGVCVCLCICRCVSVCCVCLMCALQIVFEHFHSLSVSLVGSIEEVVFNGASVLYDADALSSTNVGGGVAQK